MTPRMHAIRVILGSPSTPTRVIEGSDERTVCIQAEEVVRDHLMQGAGIGLSVSARDPQVEKRVRKYLAGVGHEIQTWPGERKSCDLRRREA